jgi:hypothetical protein
MPQWNQKIKLGDVWSNDDLSWEEKRDAIIPRLRRLSDDEFGGLEALLDELAGTDTVEYFDEVWGAIYDYGDDYRIWIDVWSDPIEVKA